MWSCWMMHTVGQEKFFLERIRFRRIFLHHWYNFVLWVTKNISAGLTLTSGSAERFIWTVVNTAAWLQFKGLTFAANCCKLFSCITTSFTATNCAHLDHFLDVPVIVANPLSAASICILAIVDCPGQSSSIFVVYNVENVKGPFLVKNPIKYFSLVHLIIRPPTFLGKRPQEPDEESLTIFICLKDWLRVRFNRRFQFFKLGAIFSILFHYGNKISALSDLGEFSRCLLKHGCV